MKYYHSSCMSIISACGSPVAFTASRSSSTVVNKQKLIFDKVITNVGGAYSNTTGVFSCPSDGLFVFSWTLMAYKGLLCGAYLNKKGRRQNSLQAWADLHEVSTTSESQSTMTGAFLLSKGDQIWIETGDYCSSFYGTPRNVFSGWQL